MDLVDTLPEVRYWSEVLCCTITTHISDLEVTDFEILSFWLKLLEVYIFISSEALVDLVDTLPDIRYWSKI